MHEYTELYEVLLQLLPKGHAIVPGISSEAECSKIDMMINASTYSGMSNCLRSTNIFYRMEDSIWASHGNTILIIYPNKLNTYIQLGQSEGRDSGTYTDLNEPYIRHIIIPRLHQLIDMVNCNMRLLNIKNDG